MTAPPLLDVSSPFDASSNGELRSLGPRLAKRGIDVVVAAVLLVAVAPLVLAVIAWLRRSGPALFHQVRVGRHGEPIRIVKLRTMVPDAEERLERDPHLRRLYEEHGYKVPVELDPRITRLGRVLRATSLDELPQLVGVLRGDLSMVGPRPVCPEQMDDYARRGVASAYLAARPGLTGLWQVSGRSSVSYDERVELDLAYLANWRLRDDLWILVRTVGVVLSRRGAH